MEENEDDVQFLFLQIGLGWENHPRSGNRPGTGTLRLSSECDKHQRRTTEREFSAVTWQLADEQSGFLFPLKDKSDAADATLTTTEQRDDEQEEGKPRLKIALENK